MRLLKSLFVFAIFSLFSQYSSATTIAATSYLDPAQSGTSCSYVTGSTYSVSSFSSLSDCRTKAIAAIKSFYGTTRTFDSDVFLVSATSTLATFGLAYTSGSTCVAAQHNCYSTVKFTRSSGLVNLYVCADNWDLSDSTGSKTSSGQYCTSSYCVDHKSETVKAWVDQASIPSSVCVNNCTATTSVSVNFPLNSGKYTSYSYTYSGSYCVGSEGDSVSADVAESVNAAAAQATHDALVLKATDECTAGNFNITTDANGTESYSCILTADQLFENQAIAACGAGKYTIDTVNVNGVNEKEYFCTPTTPTSTTENSGSTTGSTGSSTDGSDSSTDGSDSSTDSSGSSTSGSGTSTSGSGSSTTGSGSSTTGSGTSTSGSGTSTSGSGSSGGAASDDVAIDASLSLQSTMPSKTGDFSGFLGSGFGWGSGGVGAGSSLCPDFSSYNYKFEILGVSFTWDMSSVLSKFCDLLTMMRVAVHILAAIIFLRIALKQ